VDAILGAAKQMHTVIAQECTGCDLCKAPCPVDCITMIPVKQAFAETDVRASERDREKANLARRRYQFRQRRLALEKAGRASRLHNKKSELQTAAQAAEKIAAEKAAKKAAILAAVERVRAKRAKTTAAQGNVHSSDKQTPPSVPPTK
jgi:electron transport complex protein RnfB